MSNNSEHKLVYYDIDREKFYWIDWYDSGNNDIAIKHYIEKG